MERWESTKGAIQDFTEAIRLTRPTPRLQPGAGPSMLGKSDEAIQDFDKPSV
jgi:hypothetical protein